ncbi:MAG: AMP-binding protein [Halioglobus sp.]|nr:AMP-binding protein [Halioglobus sp.]
MKQAHYLGESKPLLTATIGQCLENKANEQPDHPALVVCHQDIRWTYREFLTEVDRLAAGLLALGTQPGDRVGIWAPNCYEWVLTQFATARIGAILVCINPAYRLYELEYALNKVECSVLVTAEQFKTSHYLNMLNELAPELAAATQGELAAEKLPQLKAIVRMGVGKTPGMFNFADVCDMGREQHGRIAEIGARLNPDDIINIQFTSGTTGNPKGAALTHTGILNNALFNGEKMRFSAADRLCIPVPLYHCFGMVMGTLTCVVHGATMVLPAEVFEPGATLQAVQDEQCTALHGVPTMFFGELNLPNFASYNLASLRTGMIAGATCPEELMKRLIDEMDLTEIVIAYGQTECSPVNHATDIDDTFEQRTASVGRPHDNWEVKIIREDGSIADVEEIGEVCAKGYGVMACYWGDPERTAETIDSAGFLHSGDLGVMDENGFVRITGRIKDMVIRGGENIYPREIEEFLCKHPDIDDAQVFGVPDEKYGEQLAVWVLPKDGASLGEDDIREFCADQISHYKVPRYIKFVDEYPMTVTGKIQKFVMRKAYSEELGLGSA